VSDRRQLVLASSSPYRRELLGRLGLSFEAVSPDIDETPSADEAPAVMVLRLANGKADAVAARFPDALIIGSDQCLELDDRVVGKPRDHEDAVAQLLAQSGRTVCLHTALVVLDARTGTRQQDVVPFQVRFRGIDRAMAERYLAREPAYDCTGSLRSEGLGIALLERLEGEDPNALIGLPLIRLTTMLERAGLPVL
jgi:septum formation protein